MVLARRLGVSNQRVHLSSQELCQESMDVALEGKKQFREVL